MTICVTFSKSLYLCFPILYKGAELSQMLNPFYLQNTIILSSINFGHFNISWVLPNQWSSQ